MKPSGFPSFVIAAAILAGCSPPNRQEQPPAAPENPSAAESRVKHGANGEIVITLDEAIQRIMGLQTAPLEAARLSPEIRGYGRVLDTLPLATQVTELAAAQAAGEASQAELRRLKTLAGQNNASERALQAAEAAATRDSASAESARLKLLAGWGSAIAGRKDLPDLARSLTSLTACLVELNVPPGESIQSAPISARLFTLADPSRGIEAQIIGPAPRVDPQTQGDGFHLLVSPNPSRLAPGMAVTGLLTFPGEAEQGVIVPPDALIRFNGATWVYLRTGNQSFQRAEAALRSPMKSGWFVRTGLKPGDNVVTTGAQQLLSEELKGSGGEE